MTPGGEQDGLIGQGVGRFRLVRLLGEGGMSAVSLGSGLTISARRLP